jgi:hypothetical protein
LGATLGPVKTKRVFEQEEPFPFTFAIIAPLAFGGICGIHRPGQTRQTKNGKDMRKSSKVNKISLSLFLNRDIPKTCACPY